MSPHARLRSWLRPHTRTPDRRSRARLGLESLEQREVPAALAVADVTVREGAAALGALDPAGAAAVGLDGPRDIAFNNLPGHVHANDLFVVGYATRGVVRFDWETQTYHPFVTPGSGGLGEAFGLAFGPDGNLYVTALDQHQVLRFDGTDGHFIDTYVADGSGGLVNASGLTFGPDGNLYVSSCHQSPAGMGQVLKYQGPTVGGNGEQPGQFLGVFADTGDGSTPDELTFGPDGNLYVTLLQFNTPAPDDALVRRYQGPSGAAPGQVIDDFIPAGRGGITKPRSPVFDAQGNLYIVDTTLKEVLRFQGPGAPNPGAYVEATVTTGQGGLAEPIGLAVGPDGNLYMGERNADRVSRFAPAAEARFVVTLDAPSASTVSVNYATANVTATAGGDYAVTSGTLVFAPGETSKTVSEPILDDLAGEPTETFRLNLSGAVNATIGDGQGVATVLDNETKFYVVDGGTPHTYEYGSGGTPEEGYAAASGNAAPRGAASTAAGDKVWVVDANKTVYVYSAAGALLGSWAAGSLAANATVEGITVWGTDVWIVDAKQDKVFRYTGAATRLSGSQNAAGSFNLNGSNGSPTDLVTDGTSVWVVNDAANDKVFKYTLAGSLLGNWTMTGAGGSPTGITLDPTGASLDLWVVDNATDRVYSYAGARSRTSGSQAAAASFALAAGNTNPQGIADPPSPAPSGSASGNRTAAASPATATAVAPRPGFVRGDIRAADTVVRVNGFAAPVGGTLVGNPVSDATDGDTGSTTGRPDDIAWGVPVDPPGTVAPAARSRPAIDSDPDALDSDELLDPTRGARVPATLRPR